MRKTNGLFFWKPYLKKEKKVKNTTKFWGFRERGAFFYRKSFYFENTLLFFVHDYFTFQNYRWTFLRSFPKFFRGFCFNIHTKYPANDAILRKTPPKKWCFLVTRWCFLVVLWCFLGHFLIFIFDGKSHTKYAVILRYFNWIFE